MALPWSLPVSGTLSTDKLDPAAPGVASCWLLARRKPAQLNQPSEKDFLTQIAKKCFGPDFVFRVSPLKPGEEVGAKAIDHSARKIPEAPVPSTPLEETEQDPAVKTALDVFKGTITDVKTVKTVNPTKTE